MYYLGLDLGSSYTKGVLVDAENCILQRHAVKTAYSFERAVNQVIDTLTPERDIHYPVAACGYGRDRVPVPHRTFSEITALVKAVTARYQGPLIIIDIGGQDTKFINVGQDSTVLQFKLNRKCAAGTGSFLDEIAYRLDVPAKSFSALAAKAKETIRLNSYCTVFAVSEVIGMIKEGKPLPSIIHAVYASILDRCLEMGKLAGRIILTGGTPSIHPGLAKMLKERFSEVHTPQDAQFLAAYGAHLLNMSDVGG